MVGSKLPNCVLAVINEPAIRKI